MISSLGILSTQPDCKSNLICSNLIYTSPGYVWGRLKQFRKGKNCNHPKCVLRHVKVRTSCVSHADPQINVSF